MLLLDELLVVQLYRMNYTDFTVGQRVQAVDELGRWEAGRIVHIPAEGDEERVFVVRFPGWGSQFDRLGLLIVTLIVCCWSTWRDRRTPS